MIKKIRNWLIEPLIKNLDVDSVDITVAHREVLKKKYMLKKLFENFYYRCDYLDKKHFYQSKSNKRLEIGSGSSFIKEFYPDIMTSDIKPLPFVDLVCDATQMPFPDNDLRAIYGINVFHHIPNPRLFFQEALRVLAPGGGIILIEPYHGPMARKLFSNLHDSEGFDMTSPNWETPVTGPMSNSNQALSYIVFKRDRELFEREFPELEIVIEHPHTHLWYLLSGGVNFRQLVPNWGTIVIKGLEKLLSPLNHWIAFQQSIVIRKRISREV